MTHILPGSCTGRFTTFTQGGWGAACSGNNPGCYRDANFAAAFPSGMLLGCTRTLALTTASAVEVFIPCGGPASVLVNSYVNPSCINNVLAGQLAAATLNVVFDAYDANFSNSPIPLGSLVVASGPLAGLTVNQLLTEANNALGGCGSTYSLSAINSALDDLNRNFDNGNQDLGNLVCPYQTPTCGGVSATDNCDPAPQLVCDETIIPGNCPNSYTIVHSWTATDDCGNVTTATQTITVIDDVAPVLSGVPADANLTCGTVPPAATVTATDNCGGTPTVTMTETTTGSGCNLTVVRTWTATDACGNASSATQTITTSDTEAPVLAGVPADASVECDAVPAAATVTATDNCTSNPAVTFSETSTPGSCANSYTLVRTWTSTDACGNVASASQTLNVSDSQAPVLSNVDSVVNASCDNVPPAPSVTATDNCDGSPTVTYTSSSTPGSCANSYTIVRTWTATDACGNSASKTQTVNVADNTGPVLVGVPANITVSCDAVSHLDTASSNCNGGFRTQTQGAWGAACNGNNSGCYRNANFAAAFPGGLVVGCNFTLTLTSAAAVENFEPCGGTAAALTSSLVDPACNSNVLAGQLVAATLNVGFDAFDANFSSSNTTLGDLIIASGPMAGLTVDQVLAEANNALGGCGSSYSINDIVATLDAINQNFDNGNQDLGNLNCPPTCGGVTATDNCDPHPVVTCSEAIVPGNCGGNYTIVQSWTATDACGNVTTATRTVTVVDNSAPVLVGVPADINAVCGSIPPAATVTATDNCSSNPTVTMTETTTGSGCNQTVVRTWTATDACGNSSSASQTITISDNVAPVLAGVPADINAVCGSIPSAANVTATDNCDSNPSVTMTETTTGSGCNQTVVRTWTATDACGNSSSASQTITISDNVAPVLAGVPADINAVCGSIPSAANVTATDNCDSNPSVTMTETTSGSGCNQTVVRTWTATDACGNSSSASQTITISDNVAPVLAGVPADINAVCGSIPSAANVTATDNCDSNPSVTMTETTSGSGCNQTVVRTWTATDACGNSSSASQTITISDNVAPVLAGVPANVTVQCNAVPAPATVTATDNCTNAPVVSLSSNTTPGNCPNRYTITRTWTSTDACGNTATASQVITVVDNTAPTAVCRNITVQAGSNGSATIVGSDINNGSSDNCSGTNLSLSVSQNTVSCGSTTVILTVGDQCGNSSSCSATVTVNSGCQVEFSSCPSNITTACVNNSNCQQGAYVNWTVPTATAATGCPTNTCPTNTTICGYTYLGEYDGHRYYLSSSSASWSTARTSAISAGGYLTTINSTGENTFLTNALSSIDAWIGFTDYGTEGNFNWTAGGGSSYTNWYPGEPNNQTPNCCGDADYAVINGGGGQWYDRGSCECNRWIMEVNCVSNTCPVSVTRIAGPGPGSFFPAGSTTTITYIASTNGDTDTCSFTVTVGNCAFNYCNSYASCSGYEWIRNVAVANLNNTSGSNGGYANFTQYAANVSPGQTYALTLRPGFSGSSYQETWRVWVDWNRDGDFYDANETVFTGTSSSSIFGSLTVPSNATAGSTRMRVSMQYGCNTAGPCTSFNYGEVEDYTVTVSTNARIAPGTNGQPEDAAEAEAPATSINYDGLEVVTLYPNPVRDRLNVTFTSLRAGSMKVEVMTIDGRVVKSTVGQAYERDNNYELNVSDLSAGTYMLKLSMGDVSSTEKFVKQ